MEVEENIRRAKVFSSAFLDYLEDSDDLEEKYQSLIEIIKAQYFITNNKNEILQLLNFILNISNNYHRTPNFFSKIGRILKFIISDNSISMNEIDLIQFFEKNKRILLLLFDEKIIIPTEEVRDFIFKNKSSEFCHFLYGGIKPYLSNDKQKDIETKIQQKYNYDIKYFIEKCRIGENDSFLSQLIRNDSIENFIEYCNKYNISPNSTLNQSIFETNDFLQDKPPSLIEYASFFGSIQVIEYLHKNGAKLKKSMWLYSIHSNNAELIYFLEENHVKPKDETFNECFSESIKCHHNEFAVYIKDNYVKRRVRNFVKYYNNYYNYYFFPDDSISLITNSENSEFKLCDLCYVLSEISIPSSVTLICPYAFDSCTKLVKINIPSSVTMIKESAFKSCSSLTSIEIPSSVTSICPYTFYGCSKLKQIEIPSSVTLIGEYSFYNCSSLVKIKIPSAVTSIKNSTFFCCSSLTSIEIPTSVTSICSYAFYGCSMLKQIEIPSSVTSIGDYAFYGCSKDLNATIPSSVVSIGKNAFN